MTESSQLDSLWDRTYQVGVVVRDLERAVSFYEAIGIGPFEEGPSGHAIDRRIYGKLEPDAEVKGLIAQMGSIEFELLQPVRGKSIQGEFLEKHGEGVVHICAHTDDLDRDVEIMTGLGFPVISSAELDDGGKFAYFDTREVGGLVLELFQPGGAWA
jgi:4-hydroxyphenylpyruvate dioxygenase-like putative hemolysin